MKIVFIGGRDIHALGGIESYMYNLSHKLVEMGHEPIVYCESNHNKIITEQGIKIIHIKSPKNKFICKPLVGLQATIRTICKEKKVDVIHYNAWPPSLWSFIPRIFGIKTILQEHGFEWKHTKYSKSQTKILKLMERLTAYTNTNIICVSKEQNDYFKTHYNINTTVIPTAVNLPQNINYNSNILKKYNLSNRNYFLFLGRLSKEKNLESLILAFNNLVTDYKLVIAGKNTIEPEYEDYLKNISSNQNIIFTGAIYGDDKYCLMSNAFAFCLVSSCEGLSIALLEAMSFKLPIIASNIRANKDVLKNNAVYVRPENSEDILNAYNYCLTHKEVLSTYTINNYALVKEQYTWDIVSSKYKSYISHILKQ